MTGSRSPGYDYKSGFVTAARCGGQVIDVCIILDATVCTKKYVAVLGRSLHERVSWLQQYGDQHRQYTQVRIAIVLYRGEDAEEQLRCGDFTTDAMQVSMELERTKFQGRRTTCSDLMNALQAAKCVRWAARSRLIFLLTHQPCNGCAFSRQRLSAVDALGKDLRHLNIAALSFVGLGSRKPPHIGMRLREQHPGWAHAKVAQDGEEVVEELWRLLTSVPSYGADALDGPSQPALPAVAFDSSARETPSSIAWSSTCWMNAACLQYCTDSLYVEDVCHGLNSGDLRKWRRTREVHMRLQMHPTPFAKRPQHQLLYALWRCEAPSWGSAPLISLAGRRHLHGDYGNGGDWSIERRLGEACRSGSSAQVLGAHKTDADVTMVLRHWHLEQNPARQRDCCDAYLLRSAVTAVLLEAFNLQVAALPGAERQPHLKILQGWSAKLNNTHFVLEAQLSGAWRTWEFGHDDALSDGFSELLETFSHFTLLATDGALQVTAVKACLELDARTGCTTVTLSSPKLALRSPVPCLAPSAQLDASAFQQHYKCTPLGKQLGLTFNALPMKQLAPQQPPAFRGNSAPPSTLPGRAVSPSAGSAAAHGLAAQQSRDSTSAPSNGHWQAAEPQRDRHAAPSASAPAPLEASMPHTGLVPHQSPYGPAHAASPQLPPPRTRSPASSPAQSPQRRPQSPGPQPLSPQPHAPPSSPPPRSLSTAASTPTASPHRQPSSGPSAPGLHQQTARPASPSTLHRQPRDIGRPGGGDGPSADYAAGPGAAQLAPAEGAGHRDSTNEGDRVAHWVASMDLGGPGSGASPGLTTRVSSSLAADGPRRVGSSGVAGVPAAAPQPLVGVRPASSAERVPEGTHTVSGPTPGGTPPMPTPAAARTTSLSAGSPSLAPSASLGGSPGSASVGPTVAAPVHTGSPTNPPASPAGGAAALPPSPTSSNQALLRSPECTSTSPCREVLEALQACTQESMLFDSRLIVASMGGCVPLATGCVLLPVHDTRRHRDRMLQLFPSQRSFEAEKRSRAVLGDHLDLAVEKPMRELPDGLRHGHRVVPFMVLETVETLPTWLAAARTPRSTAAIVQVLGDVAESLANMHSVAGWVHACLTPSKLVKISWDAEACWTFVDWTHASPQGVVSPLLSDYVSPYMAPEVFQAQGKALQLAAVDLCAADVWTFGAIAFEILTSGRADGVFQEPVDALPCLRGHSPWPWEGRSAAAQESMRKLGAARSLVLSCLDKDPSRRPKAPHLSKAVFQLLHKSAGL